MRRPARRSWLVLPLVGLLVLTACSRSEKSHLNSELADREDKLPSCAADGCTAEVAVLAAALAKLPGVVRVVEPSYTKAQGTSGADVSGSLVVESGVECDALREQVAELGWTSSVSPLTSMDLGCGTTGSDLDLQNAGYVFIEVRPQTREQLEAWGDRGTLRPPS